jgi:glycosyltransferase involved in cell wall biosynthesis
MSAQVLALDAYHGGSHAAFLSGWSQASRHDFTVLSLPPYKWKWRMRHAAVTLSEWSHRRVARGERWDVLFCTDMLNLAEFRGLCPEPVRRLPAVVYFHENQLTYPNRREEPRDLHFAFTNLTTALAADRVWFNSGFHQREFLSALEQLLRRMPDHRPQDAPSDIQKKSAVHPPGIHHSPPPPARRPGPLRIVWAARWEHDKDPNTFFQALRQLDQRGCDFRVSVLGQSFDSTPECFQQARSQLMHRIDHWGYAADHAQYLQVLAEADTIVSTARHEFFGIALVEAMGMGCIPLVPQRLSYPEIIGNRSACFYDGSADHLTDRLAALASACIDGPIEERRANATALARRYLWRTLVPRMDAEIDALVHNGHHLSR